MQCRCLGAAVEAWSEPDAEGRGALAGRRGRRAGLHQADAVDAALLLGRRPPATAGATTTATSTCTPASGATATGCASRRAAARSSTAAATRPSTGTASAWARPSCTARSRRCPRCSTASSSTSSTSAARATCRCSSCCARACVLDDALTRRIKDGIRAALSPRHVPNEIFQVGVDPAHAVGQEDGAAGQEAAARRAGEQVFKLDAMANADSVAWFAEFARRRAARDVASAPAGAAARARSPARR